MTVELFHHRSFCSGLAPACCTCCWQSLPRKSLNMAIFFASSVKHHQIKWPWSRVKSPCPLKRNWKDIKGVGSGIGMHWPYHSAMSLMLLALIPDWGPHSIAASPRLSPACKWQKPSKFSMGTVRGRGQSWWQKNKNLSMPECVDS